MKLGSTFSGIGGFDLAAERLGIKVAWQIEIDKAASAVLRKRFPSTPRYENITEVSGDDLSAVDLLAGGFPCQDLSAAGRRVGLAGSRSGLFWEFARLAYIMEPTWILLENVPGLLSSNQGKDMGAVLRSLEELGYGWAYRILDAQNWGVPQRRRRVFIVGYRGPREGAAAVLFEREGSRGSAPTGRAQGSEAAVDVGSSTYPSVPIGYALSTSEEHYDREQTYVIDATASALTASNGHHGHSSPRGDGTDNLVIQQSPIYCVHSDAQRDGVNLVPGPDAEGRVRLRDAGLGVIKDHAYCLTATAPHSIAFQQTQDPISGVRRLMPVECERLQGFPDGWTCLYNHPQPCDCKDGPRYKQMGNAVAVPVVRWILARMLDVQG